MTKEFDDELTSFWKEAAPKKSDEILSSLAVEWDEFPSHERVRHLRNIPTSDVPKKNIWRIRILAPVVVAILAIVVFLPENSNDNLLASLDVYDLEDPLITDFQILDGELSDLEDVL